MITYGGKQFDVNYVGNVNIEEASGAALTVDAWGLDQITRKYKGGLTKLPAFLKTLGRNRQKADVMYPGLTLATYNFTENGPWAEGEVVYKGTHDGTIPAPIPPSTGLSLETVSLAFYDGAEADNFPTVELTYYAPTTTWRYVSRTRPKVPQTRGQMEGAQEITIKSRRGAAGPFRIFSGGTLGQPVTEVSLEEVGYFNGVAMTSTKTFDVQPAGIYFEVTETNTRTIFPFQIANFDWVITP